MAAIRLLCVVIAGTAPGRIVAAWQAMRGSAPAHRTPPLWDGHAAERIVGVLESVL